MFVFEKPLMAQWYYITEIQIVELVEEKNFIFKMENPVKTSFTTSTSRGVNYNSSTNFIKFLTQAIKTVKNQDKLLGLKESNLQKRGNKKSIVQKNYNIWTCLRTALNSFSQMFWLKFSKYRCFSVEAQRNSKMWRKDHLSCWFSKKNTRKRTLAKS